MTLCFRASGIAGLAQILVPLGIFLYFIRRSGMMGVRFLLIMHVQTGLFSDQAKVKCTRDITMIALFVAGWKTWVWSI